MGTPEHTIPQTCDTRKQSYNAHSETHTEKDRSPYWSRETKTNIFYGMFQGETHVQDSSPGLGAANHLC